MSDQPTSSQASFIKKLREESPVREEIFLKFLKENGKTDVFEPPAFGKLREDLERITKEEASHEGGDVDEEKGDED